MNATNEHTQALAFSIVGVVLMAWGLGGAARSIAHQVSLRSSAGIQLEFEWKWIADSIVYLAAGLLLFLRGRGLAALWHRMRYGGVRVRPTDDT